MFQLDGTTGGNTIGITAQLNVHLDYIGIQAAGTVNGRDAVRYRVYDLQIGYCAQGYFSISRNIPSSSTIMILIIARSFSLGNC
jgi:hypothetical protein